MNSNNDNLMNNIKSDLYEICINIKNSLNKSDLDKLINGTNEDINNTSGVPILINYLKSHINFILKEKMSSEIINNSFNGMENTEIIRQLESYIRKLESDIKFYIKRHYENKIFRDSLEMKLKAYIQLEEDYEELKQKVRYDDGKFLENDRKENEIIILRRENSNLKREITKINKKMENFKELENKYSELEKVHINDEENIKNLNLKIEQLNIQISELNEKLSNSSNNKNKKNKLNFEKYNISSSSKISKLQDTNYMNPLSFFSGESKHIKSRTTKTMDSNKYNFLLKSNTFSKDIISLIQNTGTKNDKKKISNSKSLLSEKKETSQTINKLIQSKDNNYFKKQSINRTRSLKRKNKVISEYKYHISNNNAQKSLSIDKTSNKNSIYEHSALNILGIQSKYKI